MPFQSEADTRFFVKELNKAIAGACAMCKHFQLSNSKKLIIFAILEAWKWLLKAFIQVYFLIALIIIFFLHFQYVRLWSENGYRLIKMKHEMKVKDLFVNYKQSWCPVCVLLIDRHLKGVRFDCLGKEMPTMCILEKRMTCRVAPNVARSPKVSTSCVMSINVNVNVIIILLLLLAKSLHENILTRTISVCCRCMLTFKALNFWKFTSYCSLKPLWSYLADPTSPIPSHCASIVATSTVRVKAWSWRHCAARSRWYCTCKKLMW